MCVCFQRLSSCSKWLGGLAPCPCLWAYQHSFPCAWTSPGNVCIFGPRPVIELVVDRKEDSFESELGWMLATTWLCCGTLGKSLSLCLLVRRNGIIFPICRTVVGIRRENECMMIGTGEVFNMWVPFILYFLSFGCLEKSPCCPPKDITHF